MGRRDVVQLGHGRGLNQRCPLSSIFAAIVLNKVLLPLDTSPRCHMATCLTNLDPHDDGNRGITHLLAYVDNNSTAIPLEDPTFFFVKFERLAKSLSVNINAMKTRIMLWCNGASAPPSIFQELPGHIVKSVCTTLDKYSIKKNGPKVEILDGIRLLGGPVCNSSFVNTFLHAAADATDIATDKLHAKIIDLQTRLHLFNIFVIEKLPQLLGNEVLHTPPSHLTQPPGKNGMARLPPESTASFNPFSSPSSTST